MFPMTTATRRRREKTPTEDGESWTTDGRMKVDQMR